MSRVEELPKDQHALTDNVSSTPSIPTLALPPQMASTQSATIEEVAADLKRTPFFMTSLEDDEASDNVELAAMQALQYEGTRAEIAQGFRENGNEMARAKKWADGKEFYTQALTALRIPRKEDEPDETEKEREVEEACYVNRALCNLELSGSIKEPFQFVSILDTRNSLLTVTF